MTRAEGERVAIGRARGRPMLSWVGKRPLREVRSFPAQLVSRVAPDAPAGSVSDLVDWSDWPDRFDRGGLLFHGDNKEVLAHLLANGFRGKVDLVYIDPPFDSGADYVRKVQLRGASGSARLDGESYTLGEQIQYTDIWANDTYLQFMYERLQLLRELLRPQGVLYMHLDWRRVAQLRLILDELFGPESFRNEIVWAYKGKGLTGDKGKFPSFHASILAYSRGERPYFTPVRESEMATSVLERWGSYLREDGTITFGDLRRGNEEAELNKAIARFRKEHGEDPQDDDVAVAYEGGALIRDVWVDIPVVRENSRYRSWHEYPTEKPAALLERILHASSPPGGIVLDCFIGSGTTADVAQRLGLRWIGADINKGAIQTTEKRLAAIIGEQIEAAGTEQLTVEQDEERVRPAQLSFTVHRVNDYDLQVQHNEAVELAVQHLGVQRTRADGFFAGTLGRELVYIVPFDHPATVLDLQAVVRELEARPGEDRDVLVVGLGRELSTQPWLETHNRHRPVNRIRLVDLRTDPRHGRFFEHRPASATVRFERADGRVRVSIEEFVSPSILERLAGQEGVLAPQIADWRAMVDSVAIDTAYEGDVFDVDHIDIPERRSDVVEGSYEVELPAASTAPVAVRITDMLGEEILVVEGLA